MFCGLAWLLALKETATGFWVDRARYCNYKTLKNVILVRSRRNSPLRLGWRCCNHASVGCGSMRFSSQKPVHPLRLSIHVENALNTSPQKYVEGDRCVVTGSKKGKKD